jgi:hypothetical protein
MMTVIDVAATIPETPIAVNAASRGRDGGSAMHGTVCFARRKQHDARV